MFNWDQISNQVASKNNKKEFLELEYPKEGVTYFRMKPFTNEDGEAKLFKQFFHHWVPVPVELVNRETGEKEVVTKRKVVPCEGKDCRFCKIANELKEANIRDSFMYKANVYDIVLGSVIEKSGTNSYTYTKKDSNGLAKLTPIVFQGSKKQARALEEFFSKDNLYSIQETQPMLIDKTSIGQIFETILSNESGLILKMDTKKNVEGRWATAISLVPVSKTLPEDNIDLNKEVYADFDENDLEKAYQSLKNIARELMGSKGHALHEPEEEPKKGKPKDTSTISVKEEASDLDDMPDDLKAIFGDNL